MIIVFPFLQLPPDCSHIPAPPTSLFSFICLSWWFFWFILLRERTRNFWWIEKSYLSHFVIELLSILLTLFNYTQVFPESQLLTNKSFLYSDHALSFLIILKYEMFPKGSPAEYIASNGRFCFGKWWWKWQEIWHSWKNYITGGMTWKVSSSPQSFFSWMPSFLKLRSY